MSSGHSIPNAAHDLPPVPAEKVTAPFTRFLALSSAGGILLLICTAIALVWANTGLYEAYHYIFHDLYLKISIGDTYIGHGLAHWINDALMAVFFLVVGLEIKRELLVGELSSPRKAALPIIAAIGGMVVPAGIFAVMNWGQPSIRGWGVPMATDIAFALGILLLLGKRAPTPLKVFLLSLAIIDDLGALLVIAVFYTEDLAFSYLGYALATLGVLVGLNIMGVRKIVPFVVGGIFMWYFMLESGVHATIAGVLTAMSVPATARVDSARFVASSRQALEMFEDAAEPGKCVRTNEVQRAALTSLEQNAEHVLPPLHRLEHMLHPYAAFLIIPIFALANAGLHLGPDSMNALGGSLTLGILAGLFFGKPLGIFLACYLAVKFNLAALPTGVSWRQLLGVGFLAGIGFTMALFIANLAFPNPAELEAAKMGIMLASLASSVMGAALLLASPARARAKTPQATPA